MAKNPWLAAALSFLVAGLGQLYVGSVWKGLGFIILDFITAYVYLNVDEGFGFMLNLAVGVASIVDAYNGAKKTGYVEPKRSGNGHPEVRVF